MRTLIIASFGIAAFAAAAHAQTAIEQRAITRDFERRVWIAVEHFDCSPARAEKPDVLFTMPVSMVFRQLIHAALDQQRMPMIGAPRRTAAAHLDVCDPFPFAESTPLLEDVAAVLPMLPSNLEYRFLGNDLIVRDIGRNMVFGVLREAIRPATTMTQ
jgi:hypothetical protein